jgi:hypothetical protein
MLQDAWCGRCTTQPARASGCQEESARQVGRSAARCATSLSDMYGIRVQFNGTRLLSAATGQFIKVAGVVAQCRVIPINGIE